MWPVIESPDDFQCGKDEMADGDCEFYRNLRGDYLKGRDIDPEMMLSRYEIFNDRRAQTAQMLIMY